MAKDKALNKVLEKLEDLNYKGGSWALSPHASPLEKTKYELCKRIIIYKHDNKFSTEDIAQKIQLSKVEVEDILHYHLDYFTLDRLVNYASKLFEPLKVGIIEAKDKKVNARV